ncbi:kinase-like protein [Thelephora ganbajun]|uniref:Kinase-like protein n=1 Tax=Thelephora ganbajun TaxID=370292 RepID=A0ACB6Z2U0_THEGA|nr:kinase-like protein [Thelephora ganbajun]
MAPPTHPALQQISHLDTSSPDFHDQLENALRGREYRQCVSNIEDDDLTWLVNYLDEVLDRLDLSSPVSRKCLRELRKICTTRAILPTSYTLSTDLLDIGTDPLASGGFGDVVCAKRLRVYTQDGPQKTTKAFCREAVMWKYLKHPNILPLLGVTSPLQLISEWMSNGNLSQYIRRNSEVDRLQLLCEVANGLCYLHSCNVIHGGIKGVPNVLVDDSGHARIIDFGEATLVKGEDSVEDDSDRPRHTLRWAAPEVLSERTSSKAADVFSFAMLMIEILTDAIPFSDRSSLMAVLAITQGRRPSRPKHPAITGGLWTLIQRCWNQDPKLRPEAVEVLKDLLACNPPTWKLLIGHTLPTGERIPLIASIFSDRNEAEVFEYISSDDARAFVEVVDEALDDLDSLPPPTYRRFLRTSYRICGHQVLLPKSLAIPLCYNAMEIPHCRGGFADVWKGQYNGLDVAAKALKVYSTDNFDRIRRTFCREVMTWRTLRHPNVLPLLGMTMTENQFVMVSEWMYNGNINEFLRRNGASANRLELLRDTTKGLVYMHDQGIVHGDLKGANIMIDKDGHARLADFSLVTSIPDQSTFVSSCIEGGTIPWMSPELLDPESFDLKERRPTRGSDCYALGMVIYEVLSGQAPFAAYSPFSALTKVLRGERPKRPQGEGGRLFTDGIWEVVELCWKREPGDRASAKDVFQCLGGTPSLSRPSFNVDDDAETDSDDQSDATPDDS